MLTFGAARFRISTPIRHNAEDVQHLIDELQIRLIELQLENEELRDALAEQNRIAGKHKFLAELGECLRRH